MYQTVDSILAIPSTLLYEDLGLISRANYKKYCQRGKINKLRTGGNGRQALIEFASLPELFKKAIIEAYGDPYKKDDVKTFIEQLDNKPEAFIFFQKYTYEDGKHLLPEKIAQYYAESQILDLYEKLIQRIKLKQHNGMRIKMGPAKTEICKVIQEVGNSLLPNSEELQYPHRLPTNYRALDNKLKKYNAEGLESLIHKSMGNDNSKKIQGAAADWIIGFYCLPNKPVIPVVHMEYMRVRQSKGWPVVSESAMSKWLSQPEQEKTWIKARHGNAAYMEKYGYKMSRDKTKWFPNAYWAIDGTKLDWVHFKENSNGMGADIKIDVVFDIYSEAIIGYSFSRTETHGDHFKAIKMAVNNTLKRPFLFTYDGQSGHTTKEMQQLYDSVVARKGGEHYKHAARQHGSPVEQLFSRFQRQILNTKWFSDKQGIKSKSADSHPNMEFLLEQRHHLKKWEDYETVFEQCVSQWNAAQHPKFDESRTEVLETHHEPHSEALTIFHVMDIFWVSTKEARNYDSDGIKPIISGKQYHYEVYDADGNVDIDFRDKYTHCKFYTQYDPDQMDNYVRLHLKLPNGKRQYVADAQPKRITETIPVLMTPEKKAQMWKDRQVKKTEAERVDKRLERIRRDTGLTEENLIKSQELEIKMGGKLPKERRNEIEALDFLNRM